MYDNNGMLDKKFAIDLITAERRGRGAVEQLHPSSRRVLVACADDSPDGHACLVAARWAHLLGIPVRVSLQNLSGTDRAASAVGTILAETIRRLRLETSPAAGLRPRLFLTDPDGREENDIPIPPDDEVWKIPVDRSARAALSIPDADAPAITCEESRAIDARAIRDFSIPGINLMENAAIGAVRVALAMLSEQGTKNGVVIVAGGGNNGGDGLAVARGLAACGIPVSVLLLKPPERLRGDAASNYAILRDNDGVPIVELSETDFSATHRLDNALVIDALLGTGFQGALSPLFRSAIQAINSSRAPVLSLDIPSGLNGDTGMVEDIAVRADATITFAALKHGLVANSGPAHTGRLYLGGIGAP